LQVLPQSRQAEHFLKPFIKCFARHFFKAVPIQTAGVQSAVPTGTDECADYFASLFYDNPSAILYRIKLLGILS